MRTVRYALMAATLLLPGTLRAQEEPPLALDLNKLEPVSAAAGGSASCRAYLVANNSEGGLRVEQLRLDLVLFGTDGVIVRRIALDIGPVPPGRTQVRPFELRDQPCEGIGEVLVNDVMLCKIGGAERTDCLDRLRLSSRVAAKFAK